MEKSQGGTDVDTNLRTLCRSRHDRRCYSRWVDSSELAIVCVGGLKQAAILLCRFQIPLQQPTSMTQTTSNSYPLDRDELLRIREMKLLTSDRDYLFFALQIDYPGKLTPTIEVDAFCER